MNVTVTDTRLAAVAAQRAAGELAQRAPVLRLDEVTIGAEHALVTAMTFHFSPPSPRPVPTRAGCRYKGQLLAGARGIVRSAGVEPA